MDKGRMAAGVVSLALLGAAAGYVAASVYLAYSRYGTAAEIDFTELARSYFDLQAARPDRFQIVNLIVGGFTFLGLAFGTAMAKGTLTKFGKTRWQTVRDLKKNGFFGKPGRGFVLGKLGKPKSRAPFLTSTVFPHAMVVAPTGRGKTSGFSIPNLLTFKGSVVALDVKGELFKETSRHRAAQGDAVYRFAPTDWSGTPSHRYNPLLRISQLKNPAQQQMELQLLATLFLQTKSERAEGLLKGGINLFVACGLYAFERGTPTLGEVYRLATEGGDKPKTYRRHAAKVQNVNAQRMFTNLSGINNDTLTSYLSLLETSGLDQWSNPAVDDATSESDFDFRAIRREPFTVYLEVQPLMVEPMAALIRLFFSDLLAALQDKAPGKDEPWPVMILLDEFNRLGKMPIVASSLETLRSYNGHLAVITQTIPALDEIYGENTRRAMQGNAGIKLYLTPADEKTIEELSQAVGMTTKHVLTRSRAIGRSPFEGRSTSERTEESALLHPDEARRMPLDDIIMVIDAQMPVRAKRIQYFKDRRLSKIHAAQTGPYPYPPERTNTERLARKIAALTSKIEQLESGRGAPAERVANKNGPAAPSTAPTAPPDATPRPAAATPETTIAVAQVTPAPTGPLEVPGGRLPMLSGGIKDMTAEEMAALGASDQAASPEMPKELDANGEELLRIGTNSLTDFLALHGGGERTATAAE